jgi:hypothetical protein
MCSTSSSSKRVADEELTGDTKVARSIGAASESANANNNSSLFCVSDMWRKIFSECTPFVSEHRFWMLPPEILYLILGRSPSAVSALFGRTSFLMRQLVLRLYKFSLVFVHSLDNHILKCRDTPRMCLLPIRTHELVIVVHNDEFDDGASRLRFVLGRCSEFTTLRILPTVIGTKRRICDGFLKVAPITIAFPVGLRVFDCALYPKCIKFERHDVTPGQQYLPNVCPTSGFASSEQFYTPSVRRFAWATDVCIFDECDQQSALWSALPHEDAAITRLCVRLTTKNTHALKQLFTSLSRRQLPNLVSVNLILDSTEFCAVSQLLPLVNLSKWLKQHRPNVHLYMPLLHPAWSDDYEWENVIAQIIRMCSANGNVQWCLSSRFMRTLFGDNTKMMCSYEFTHALEWLSILSKTSNPVLMDETACYEIRPISLEELVIIYDRITVLMDFLKQDLVIPAKAPFRIWSTK